MKSIQSQFDSLRNIDKIYLAYSAGFGFLLFTSTFMLILGNLPIGRSLERTDKANLTDRVTVSRENDPTLPDFDIVNSEPIKKPVTLSNLPTRAEPSEQPTEYVHQLPDCGNATEIGQIDTEEPIIVFSFDADGTAESTEQIVNAFEKHGLKTTFFIAGNWANRYPDMVKLIDRKGHEIFNHTQRHPNLKTLSVEAIQNELIEADNTISSLTNKTTKPFFRPPYGERDQRVRNAACQVGFQSIVWNVDGWDWRERKGISSEEVKSIVLTTVKSGNIVLMHTGNSLTGQVIDEILTTVQEMGYRPVSFTEALYIQANNITVGR